MFKSGDSPCDPRFIKSIQTRLKKGGYGANHLSDWGASD